MIYLTESTFRDFRLYCRDRVNGTNEPTYVGHRGRFAYDFIRSRWRDRTDVECCDAAALLEYGEVQS